MSKGEGETRERQRQRPRHGERHGEFSRKVNGKGEKEDCNSRKKILVMAIEWVRHGETWVQRSKPRLE